MKLKVDGVLPTNIKPDTIRVEPNMGTFVLWCGDDILALGQFSKR